MCKNLWSEKWAFASEIESHRNCVLFVWLAIRLMHMHIEFIINCAAFSWHVFIAGRVCVCVCIAQASTFVMNSTTRYVPNDNSFLTASFGYTHTHTHATFHSMDALLISGPTSPFPPPKARYSLKVFARWQVNTS